MDQRDHLLGLRGHALLRAGARGDQNAVDAHREAIRDLLASAPVGARTLRAVSPAEGYANWASTYDQCTNPTIAAEQPAVRSLLGEFPIGDAVDVGCGTGRHTRWLTERGHHVTAIDSSPEMLAVAAEAAPGAEIIVSDLRRLPLADSCADIVVCALVLSHLPDLTAIDELARLLRPRGRLVISNPHPLATAVLGSRAWTTTATGERVSIPEFAHPLGAYIDAFRANGLIPIALLEPTHPGDDALLADEPAAVVWAAQRQGKVSAAPPA